jgi:hypothetical protein
MCGEGRWIQLLGTKGSASKYFYCENPECSLRRKVQRVPGYPEDSELRRASLAWVAKLPPQPVILNKKK